MTRASLMHSSVVGRNASAMRGPHLGEGRERRGFVNWALGNAAGSRLATTACVGPASESGPLTERLNLSAWGVDEKTCGDIKSISTINHV